MCNAVFAIRASRSEQVLLLIARARHLYALDGTVNAIAIHAMQPVDAVRLPFRIFRRMANFA